MAQGGTVYMADEAMRKPRQGPGGWMNVNLRTTFLKIIKRAGLAPWDRLFHNLRSSRQTELAETLLAQVVCDWLGNSEAVAMMHYLQTTEEHFSRAVGRTPTPRQVATDADDNATANPNVDIRSKAKQKAKQSGAAKARADSLPERKHPGIADRNDNPRNPATTQADGVGFEPTRRFHVCRFSRSTKPLRALPKESPLKTRKSAPEGVLNGSTGACPSGRNRDKPRHNEPNRDHSPDKSRTSRGWRVLKWLEMAEDRDSPPCPFRINVRAALPAGRLARWRPRSKMASEGRF